MDDGAHAPTHGEGVAAWETLLRAHAALVPRVARDVLATSGLPLARYDVLLELDRAPQRRLRMQELSQRVVLSRTRVSRIVDGLVTDGMVTREVDDTDGRVVHAVITPAGRGALRRAAPVYLRAIEEHFTSHLGPSELRAVRDGLQRVLRADAPP